MCRPPLALWMVFNAMSISAHAADHRGLQRPSTSLAACAASLQAELRKIYPASRTAVHFEHSCELANSTESVIFECRGTCIDRSSHIDACEAYDQWLEITLSPNAASMTTWNRRDPDKTRWRIIWTRQYRDVRAELVSYAGAGVKRVSNRAIRRLHRIIDGCVRDSESGRVDR